MNHVRSNIWHSVDLGGSFSPRARCPALLVLAAALLLGGCAAQQSGQDLSSAGSKAANALADYYDTLATDCIDIEELSVLLSGLDPNRPPPDTQGTKDLEAVAAGMQGRAQMARKLAALYGSLGSLSSANTAGAVSNAAGGLSDAVTSLPGVRPGVQTKDLTDMIASDLATMKQSADIRQASGSVARVVHHVADLVEREQGGPAHKNDVYASIVDDRADVAANVSKLLVQRGYIDPSTVMRQMATSVGLAWDGQVRPDDAETRHAAAVIEADEVRRAGTLTKVAGETILASLRELEQQHKQLEQTGVFNAAQVSALADRARTYLDEIEKIRKQAQDRGKKAGGPSHLAAGPDTRP